MARTPYPLRYSGFTLLEMSIVIAIVALLVAMGMTAGQGTIEAARLTQTNNKLDRIEQALAAFRLAYGRLPCPSDVTLASTDSNYGVEPPDGGNCRGSSPKSTFGPAGNIVEGGVPFKVLGLPEEYSYDAWGRRIAYAVNIRVTAPLAMLMQMRYDQCGITVANDSTNYTTGAVYTLLSFGPNGHGGYLKSGSRKGDSSVNSYEQANCHCDRDLNAQAYAATYYMKDAIQDPSNLKNSFDDIVRFKEVWQLIPPKEVYNAGGGICNPGARLPGFQAASDMGVGAKVAAADVNGDGIADLIIASPSTTTGVGGGTVYVVFGSPTGFPSPLPLSSLDGKNGFEIDSSIAGGLLGNVIAAGDVNGDGIPDIVLSVASTKLNVIFGKKCGGLWGTACTNPITANDTLLNGATGYKITNITGFGFGSIAIGDTNADGINDLILGANFASPGGLHQAGTVYVVFGSHCGGLWPAACTASSTMASLLNGLDAYQINGAIAEEQIGMALAAGKIRGTAYDDIIIGAPNANSNAGKVYTVFGKTCGRSSGTACVTPLALDGTVLNGTSGFELDGTDYAGVAVSVGDINGDGVPDLAIGVSGSGSVNIVFGKTTAWASLKTLDGSYLDGVNGYKIYSPGGASDGAGTSLAIADLNHDGYGDIITGAYAAMSNGLTPGSVFVAFGKNCGGTLPTACTASQALDNTVINGTNGTRFDGVSDGDWTGWSVTTSDFNGDGIQDALIGAPYALSGYGSAYIAYGKAHGWNSSYDLSSF